MCAVKMRHCTEFCCAAIIGEAARERNTHTCIVNSRKLVAHCGFLVSYRSADHCAASAVAYRSLVCCCVHAQAAKEGHRALRTQEAQYCPKLAGTIYLSSVTPNTAQMPSLGSVRESKGSCAKDCKEVTVVGRLPATRR